MAVKANKPGFTNTLESFGYLSPKTSEQDGSRSSEIDVLRDQFNVLQRSVEASQEAMLEMMAKLLNSQGQEERNKSGEDTQNALPTADRRLAEGTSAGDMYMHGNQELESRLVVPARGNQELGTRPEVPAEVGPSQHQPRTRSGSQELRTRPEVLLIVLPQEQVILDLACCC